MNPDNRKEKGFLKTTDQPTTFHQLSTKRPATPNHQTTDHRPITPTTKLHPATDQTFEEKKYFNFIFDINCNSK